MSKNIEISPHDPNWQNIFAVEETNIKYALGDDCIIVYHIGSTSVPGLAAKPKVDIIAAVKDLSFQTSQLEAMGYRDRGGFNIPLRRTFTIKTLNKNINLHIFEENDPEIELNILFRDYLRMHPHAKDEYAQLKYELVAKESSHKKYSPFYKNYTLGKHDFIQNILNQTGFDKLRFVLCTHDQEWDSARYFRNKYFFGLYNVNDPYTWTFDHPDHKHLILYRGTKIIGYAHIQLWLDRRAAIRIIVIDEIQRNNNYGGKFLRLCEKWLKS